MTRLPAAVGDTQSLRIAAAADPFPVGTGDADLRGETDRPSLDRGAGLVHAAATSANEIAAAITPHADRGSFTVVAVAAR
ncbi:MAG: hypothetical protein M3P11_00525 [Actinomycetota bacterium]|nr:hypothetical protein [Actinomycetota bacterium]